MKQKSTQQQGFTLIELMISLVIAGFLITAMYSVYSLQERSYTVQDQVSEMQQKIRAAMDMMSREIRMAGYDPDASCESIITAETDELVFEICDPAVGDYRFTYEIDDGNLVMNRDNLNGDNDDLEGITIAEGVDAMELLYLDKNGAVTANRSEISTVKISMLVRASYPDRKYVNSIEYIPESVRLELTSDSWDINGETAGNGNPAYDNYHRRLLISSIQLRNMGL